jgi:hypothetical protein
LRELDEQVKDFGPQPSSPRRALAALEPTLALPTEQRIVDVTARLAVVRGELTASVFRGSPRARDLGEQIEEFGREAVTAGLHSLAGGPA